VAGASAQTQRVRYVNANWTAGRTDDEAFELMVVTEDEERHSVATTAAQLAVLVALTQARDVVMLWDPEGRTLIAANLLGEWIQPAWSAGAARTADGLASS
jgi:uncharacterized protein YbdZ (MbtH family)